MQKDEANNEDAANDEDEANILDALFDEDDDDSTIFAENKVGRLSDQSFFQELEVEPFNGEYRQAPVRPSARRQRSRCLL